MAVDTKTTTNHEEIRKWVEDRRGAPACIKGIGEAGTTGMLRIAFPDGAEAELEVIEWEPFFQKFDREKLIFLYQDKRIDGALSRYNEICKEVGEEQADGFFDL